MRTIQTTALLLASLSSVALADNPPPAAAPPPPNGSAPAAAADAPAAQIAVEAPPPAEKKDRGAVLIGVKAGGLFAEPFSKLGPSFLVDVELGYVLPILHRGLVLTVDGGYTQPEASGTQTDPRVDANGGSYTWSETQRELMLGVTVMYRLTLIGTGRVAPYIGVGGRLWLLDTKVNGAVGAGAISESHEQSTKFGLSVPLGVDVGLGPGRVFVEGMLLWAPIDHAITGESSVGAISVEAGYRFFL